MLQFFSTRKDTITWLCFNWFFPTLFFIGKLFSPQFEVDDDILLSDIMSYIDPYEVDEVKKCLGGNNYSKIMSDVIVPMLIVIKLQLKRL